jgi:hypothetical protein
VSITIAEGDTTIMNNLDPTTEQLVADLAADFSECIVNGQHSQIEEYLEKLPNNAARDAFRTLANMTKFVTITRVIADSEPAEQSREGIGIPR